MAARQQAALVAPQRTIRRKDEVPSVKSAVLAVRPGARVDITEYWATLVSIIIGLGVADLLMNFHRLIHDRRRVAWDALPLLWAVVCLLWLFNYWWAVATNLDGSRNARVAVEFVLLAIAPIVLFLMAASALPRAMPAEGRLDMRAEWATSRGVFFALFALNQSIAWVNAIAARGFVWDVAAIARTVVLALALTALLVRSRRLEWSAALLTLALVIWRMSQQAVR